MADRHKLTPQQVEQAISWLNERAADGGPKCPSCGKKSWHIADEMVAPPIFSGGMVLGGPVYPQIMIVCRNCAHTMFFNAAMMKIITDKEGQTGEKEEGAEEKRHG